MAVSHMGCWYHLKDTGRCVLLEKPSVNTAAGSGHKLTATNNDILCPTQDNNLFLTLVLIFFFSYSEFLNLLNTFHCPDEFTAEHITVLYITQLLVHNGEAFTTVQ